MIEKIKQFFKRKKKMVEIEPVEFFDSDVFIKKTYKEFDNVLKNNPGNIDKEYLKRIDRVDVIKLKQRPDDCVEINYYLKYNDEVHEKSATVHGFGSPKRWAEYFYGEFLKNYDPQENDPKIKELIKKAGKEANRRLFLKLLFWRKMGACHLIWNLQKKILKNRYGIDWKTPAERNSNICYD